MSSRSSRRSCSNTNQLNRCTIPLWDKKRLVKELQDRGLDISGKQPDLVDRLLAFLDGEITAPEAVTAPVTPAATKKPAKKTPVATPKTPKATPKSAATKKNAKAAKKKTTVKGKTIKQEVESEDEQEEEEEVEGEAEVPEVAPEEPEAPVEAPEVTTKSTVKIEPDEEPSSSEQPPVQERRTSKRQNKENNTPAAKKKEPKRRLTVANVEEDAPSTSEAVIPTVETNVSTGGEEKRTRRKSARLLASEQMEVDEEPILKEETPPEPVRHSVTIKDEPVDADAAPEPVVEPEQEPEPEVVVKKSKEPKEKRIRIKEEVDSDNEAADRGASSSDPDYDVPRAPRESRDSSNHHHHQKTSERPEKVQKARHSSSNAAPPPKPKQADWQLKWAEKMAQMKKVDQKPTATTEKTSEAKKTNAVEKNEVPKKQVSDSFDKITALMSSSIPKKEKVEKKVSTEPLRVSGGSDASGAYDYNRRSSIQSVPVASPKEYPMGTFFNPPVVAKPPVNFQPIAVPISALHGLAAPPPPPPPPVVVGPRRRQSRFDQPPVNYPPNFYGKANAPPPTLTTAVQISRRSPIPPPPPRRRDDIPPPPPPRPTPAASDLQRRIQEMFSSEPTSEPVAAVPLVFAPSAIKREVVDDSVPPPPPPPAKRPLVKQEPEDEDDDDFVIRDTVVESAEPSEPAAKMMKLDRSPRVEQPKQPEPNGVYEEALPKAVNKIEEQRKKEAIAEERRRRAMELGDGEYDPMETTAQEETSLVYDYQPTNTEEVYDGEEEAGDEEMDEGEDEEDEEEGDEDEEEEENDVEVVEETAEVEEVDGPIEIKHNPLDLLKLALPVLKSSLNPRVEEPKDQYAQIDDDTPTESMLKRQDDEAPAEVYYHGEPVPEVDENELYEIAAGIKPKKKEKKALVQIPEEERLPADVETIELDYYNADIHVKSAEKNIWQVEPFNQDGLALMWGGVRSNFGIKLPFRKTDKDKASKLAFQIQIEAYQSIQHLPTEFMSDGGDARIGFSLESSPLSLGEYPGSWCISGTGKRAMNNHFSELGHSFDIGDVVMCILDLETGNISYSINGKDIGTPFERISMRDGDVIFPTICTKNANINVNLGQDMSEEKWNIPEDRDWMFITEMDRIHLERTRVAPEAKKDCTVLVCVGLPGVGKTTWVRRYLAEHPHENWTLISNDMVMDAMRVNGVSRIRMPTLKRPDFLRGIIGKSMARLILLAPRRRKNYILDMSNCLAEKRKRKLMAFEEFNRKCMIFVPDEDTHQKRLIKQEHEENEKLDTDAMMQHKAAMSLPSIEGGDPCEEVIFIDPPAPNEQLAFDRVAKMNYDCRSWLQLPNRRRGYHGHGGGNHHRGNYHNNDHGYQQQHQYNRPSTSGPPSGGGANQFSPRGGMNITHTTFPSNNAPAIPSPLVRDDQPSTSSAATSSAPFTTLPPVKIEPIVLPPVKITLPVVNTPVQPSPATVKVEVSQPLTLNTSMPRKSFDVAGASPALSSGGASFSNSPRFGFPPMEPNVMTPTSIPPPAMVTPTMAPPVQPSPMIMPPVHMPPPFFPVDVTVPPPNFSAPPPPLGAAVPPHLLALHQQQMSQPPPQFNYPPPQFAPR